MPFPRGRWCIGGPLCYGRPGHDARDFRLLRECRRRPRARTARQEAQCTACTSPNILCSALPAFCRASSAKHPALGGAFSPLLLSRLCHVCAGFTLRSFRLASQS